MGKKSIIITLILAVFMFVLGGYVAFSSRTVEADLSCTSTTTTVSVVGIAKKTVSPDRGIVTVNIIASDKDANKAMEVMKDNAQYVIDVAKKYTDDKHIMTTNLSLTQRGHWEKDRYVYDDFVASEVIKIDVPVDKVGHLAGELTKDRAENVRLSGISFYFTGMDDVRKQLLEKAILDAEDNAIRLVKPLGATHISLVSVSYGSYSPRPVNELLYDAAKSSAGADIPVASGSMEISVQVSAVFQAGPICKSIEK